MTDIFGIPMNGIMVVLVCILAICLLSVGWIAWRRPVIFKLGTRNIPRRKAQTALIVVGLMLSTLIIAAALGTGDTIDHSITLDVYDNLEHVDELVVASQDINASADLTSQTPLDPTSLALVERAVAGDPNVDGVMPMLEARVPVLHEAAQLAEPDIVLTGLDPTRLDAFGGLSTTAGAAIDLSELAADEIVISERLAGEISATAGDRITVFFNEVPHELTVAAVAKDTYLGGTRRSRSTDLEFSGMTLPLANMQELMNLPGEVTAIAISNTGGIRDGVDHTDTVVANLRAELAGQSLGVDPIKQDRVDAGEKIATLFTTIFVLLGLFSVMSGVLLIVLIFTMLASERRSEMGMERAIGTHRRQLMQQFVAEGSGYAIAAGMVGAALGVLAAIGIAEGMKIIFGDYVPIEAQVSPRSLVVAYCLGLVITFLTVLIASWRISRLNIVAAIRDMPDIVASKRRFSTLLWAGLLTLAGGLLAFMGSGQSNAVLFTIGMSFVPFGIALLLRFFGAPGRPIFTLVGVYLLVFWLLPESTFSDIFGEYDFGLPMFFLSGMFLVVGATIVIVQNTDLLLAGVSKLGGLFRTKLPAVRTAVAYPGAARGRTGLTIAMFSLIVFSLVMMATMNQNYTESVLGDEANAGWDIRADTLAADPPADFAAALEAEGVDTSEFTAIGMLTNPVQAGVKVRLAGADEWKEWQVLGMDQPFLDHSTLKFGQRAVGYATDADIVQALKTQPNVAIIDSNAVPADGEVGADEDLLALEGLKSSDETFVPITVELMNPRDGSPYPVTIIGIIDGTIGSLQGLFASQETVDTVYPTRTVTSWVVALDDSARSSQVSRSIESALLHSGVQGTSIRDELKDLQRQESGFLYIIEGFMGLGLFVGVAAIGVIAFRSVVERRQQIGVLRALGFRRELVSLSFMIETAFVVGLGVLTGTALGLLLAKNLVSDPDQGFASDISFVIPWLVILPVIVLTMVVALLMTWIPARQAARIAPAEALRYE